MEKGVKQFKHSPFLFSIKRLPLLRTTKLCFLLADKIPRRKVRCEFPGELSDRNVLEAEASATFAKCRLEGQGKNSVSVTLPEFFCARELRQVGRDSREHDVTVVLWLSFGAQRNGMAV